jgi:hypothetical protein
VWGAVEWDVGTSRQSGSRGGCGMNHERLKARQRSERSAHHPNLAIRVHRALSWLERAEAEQDLDSRFVFLWIAFNAAYATDIPSEFRASEQSTFKAFIGKLLELDRAGRLQQLVWTEFPKSIRLLLDNPYVFEDFWEFQRGRLAEEEWKRRFEGAKAASRFALGCQDTVTVLSVVLHRVYTLRNQIVHGGATWKSSVNRDQVRDCVKLMDAFVPVIIETMLDNPGTVWGDAMYPVAEA